LELRLLFGGLDLCYICMAYTKPERVKAEVYFLPFAEPLLLRSGPLYVLLPNVGFILFNKEVIIDQKR
jgi:hypothetical protein